MKKTPHTGVVPERPRKRGRSSVVPPKKKPKQISCLQCGSAPAIKIESTTEKYSATAFCSKECCVEFALAEFRVSYFQWCKKHETWTKRDGACASCSNERRSRLDDNHTFVEQELFCELEGIHT